MDKKKKKDETTAAPNCESLENETASEEAVNATPPSAGVDEQTQKLTALQKELDETRDRYLRVAAEYENYRRRNARERENLYADSTAAAVAAMLPVLDNLERAAAQQTTDEAFRKGVEMTLKQFYDCLSKLGVKEIPASRLAKQKKTCEALGLTKINQTVIKKDNDATRGMIFVVKHLVTVEELKK